jgi:hypothetical protein
MSDTQSSDRFVGYSRCQCSGPKLLIIQRLGLLLPAVCLLPRRRWQYLRDLVPALNFVHSAEGIEIGAKAPKTKIQFNGVGGLLTYISFRQGADYMSDHDEWISYSHWRMVLTGTK